MKGRFLIATCLLFGLISQAGAFSIIDLKALAQRVSVMAEKIKYWENYRSKFAKYSKWFSIYKNYLRHCMLGFEKDEARLTRIQEDQLVNILNSAYFNDIEDVDPWKTILSSGESLENELKHLKKDNYVSQNWWANSITDKKLKELYTENQKRDKESLKHYREILRYLILVKRFEESTWEKLHRYRMKLEDITEKKGGSKAVMKETKLLTVSNYLDTDIIRTKVHILALLRTMFEDQAMERLETIDNVGHRGEVGRQIERSSRVFKKFLRKGK